MKPAVKTSKRPMPRPTEKRMGEMRERAKETAEEERLYGKITGGTEYNAIKEDLKAAKFKKGGCVMAGRGGKFKGAM